MGEAVRRAREAKPGLTVEVECRNLEEVREGAEAGADRLLLDNMPTPLLAEVVAAVRAVDPGVELEATGNLTLDRAREVASTGVDYLSVGGLTHSSPILDLALDLEPGLTGPRR